MVFISELKVEDDEELREESREKLEQFLCIMNYEAKAYKGKYHTSIYSFREIQQYSKALI